MCLEYEYCIDKIYQFVNGQKRKHRDEIQFRCFICGDSEKNKSKMRGHFYNNRGSSPTYHCFNCGITLGYVSFLSQLTRTPEDDLLRQIWKDLYKDEKGFIKSKLSPDYSNKVVGLEDSVDVKQVTTEDIEIKNRWLPIETSTFAVEYLKFRKLDFLLNRGDIVKLWYDDQHNALVIGYIEHGKLIYYQYRMLSVSSHPKYIFPKEREKEIFGLSQLNSSLDFIVLLEGVFDSVFCVNGVSIGGVFLTQNQEDKLNSKYFQFSKHIYLLDNQNVDKTSLRQTEKLLKNGKTVFLWPSSIKEKDVNDFILKHDKNLFANPEFILKNSVSGNVGLIKLKLACR